MYLYESCVILSPQIPEDQLDPTIEKLTAPLEAGGAQMQKTARWGKRKLAHPIGKNAYGFYVVFFYHLEVPGDTLENFERVCRFDETILREMTIKTVLKKKGTDIQPIVPGPGYLSDFEVRPRAAMRRRSGGDFRRESPGRPPAARPAEAAPEAAPEAPAGEAAAPEAAAAPAAAPAADAPSEEAAAAPE